MQKQEDGLARLKRVILIGDHHQLPPVVKNMAFQKHSHLDQSLFTRFVRLGMPYLQLNAQVLLVPRCRPGGTCRRTANNSQTLMIHHSLEASSNDSLPVSLSLCQALILMILQAVTACSTGCCFVLAVSCSWSCLIQMRYRHI